MFQLGGDPFCRKWESTAKEKPPALLDKGLRLTASRGILSPGLNPMGRLSLLLSSLPPSPRVMRKMLLHLAPPLSGGRIQRPDNARVDQLKSLRCLVWGQGRDRWDGGVGAHTGMCVETRGQLQV